MHSNKVLLIPANSDAISCLYVVLKKSIFSLLLCSLDFKSLSQSLLSVLYFSILAIYLGQLIVLFSQIDVRFRRVIVLIWKNKICCQEITVKNYCFSSFQKKMDFFSVGYLALVVSLSTKCKQIIFQIIFSN